MAAARTSALDDPNVDSLSGLIEESTRSSREGARFFVEPASNTLSRALSKRHHIVFGRRGSGKSSLLHKVLADAQADRTPIVFIDMEAFKGHSYPDVLVSVLLSTFREFRRWTKGVAIEPGSKQGFWNKLIGRRPNRAPIKDTGMEELGQDLDRAIEDLSGLLHDPEESARHTSKSAERAKTSRLDGSVGAKAGPLSSEFSIGEETARRQSGNVDDQYKHKKIATLHRDILRYRNLLERIAKTGEGHGYILLDDLYHIRSADQVDVIDYFHRIAKGTGIWLKIGTIRHRTNYYVPGDPPKGMKIGDDCEEIDLDVTLEKYQLTKSFLFRVLDQFSKECNVRLSSILTDGARDRLVIGSGGVARDFLSIFRRAISIAKERVASGDLARGDKVGAEDVNRAAGENDSYKQTEFDKDVEAGSASGLRDFFATIASFCVEKNKTNCFLIQKDSHGKDASMIAELVDFKLLHHCDARVTVRSKVGKIFEAYMLDIAQYTGERARRNLEMIEFWEPNGAEKLRRASLIFAEA